MRASSSVADSQVVPLSVVMVLNQMEKSIKEKGPAKSFPSTELQSLLFDKSFILEFQSPNELRKMLKTRTY